MLLDLRNIISKYNLEIKGVIHIGAHAGGEVATYDKLGISNVIYFEPNPVAFRQLRAKVGYKAVNLALGNFNGTAVLNIASDAGMSSSLLKPSHHLKQYPWTSYENTEQVCVARLDDVVNGGYNMINIDTEGYELEVFRGGMETLRNIDYIITEVSRVEMYEGGALLQDVDVFLALLGFVRKEVNWAGGTWGDAFYMK